MQCGNVSRRGGVLGKIQVNQHVLPCTIAKPPNLEARDPHPARQLMAGSWGGGGEEGAAKDRGGREVSDLELGGGRDAFVRAAHQAMHKHRTALIPILWAMPL